MRDIKWQRVVEASALPKPDCWNLVQVQDSAESAGIRQELLEKGKLPASAELHIWLPAPVSAYQLLEDVHQLPLGTLHVKAISPIQGELLR